MLVGRGAELEQVRSLLAGGGAVALVGPAGIGKTTLARASLGAPDRYREGGALATMAWSPLLAFRRLLRADPPELPEEVAGAVLQQGRSPVLLDDVQWSDTATLDAIAQLIGHVPVIVTIRTGEERSDLAVEALTAVGMVRIDLRNLAPEPAADLAERLHPDLTPAARERLLRAADGNPLLLTELPHGSTAAPSLVSALLVRIGSLSGPGRAAIERLSVLGRPASRDLLGPGVHEVVEAGLAAAAGDDLVIHHSLLAEVIVEGMGGRAHDVRRDLVAVVGQHEGAHLLAACGDLAAAHRLAMEAARTGDRRQRATMLAFAIGCSTEVDARNRVRAARLFTSISEPEQARVLCAVPDVELLDPVERGSLLAADAEAAWLLGHQAEAMALVERALADLRGTNTPYEAAALAGSTVANTFVDLDGRPALARAQEAVRLADELGAEQGYTRSRLASVLLTAGEPGWAELYHEVMEGAERDGDDDLRRTALISLVLGHWITGDPLAGEVLARAQLQRGPRQEFDVSWLTIVSYAAILGLVGGRSRSELVAECSPILDRWQLFRSRPFLESSVILALADDGRHPEAGVRMAAAVARRGMEPQWRSITLWAQAESNWLAARIEPARVAAEDVLALGVGDYPSAVQARLVGGHASRGLRVPLVGPAPASLLPAWAGAPIEWSALVAATAGNHAGAVDAFVRAAEAWARSEVRAEVRCRWAAGDVAAASGSPNATALLEAAETRALALGLTAMVERIRRSLRSIGVHRRADTTGGIGGLTRREEQVLDLVGSGMRSAEAAAALGIEVSTVESFVRAAMQKLGVPTRLAAAARLRD